VVLSEHGCGVRSGVRRRGFCITYYVKIQDSRSLFASGVRTVGWLLLVTTRDLSYHTKCDSRQVDNKTNESRRHLNTKKMNRKKLLENCLHWSDIENVIWFKNIVIYAAFILFQEIKNSSQFCFYFCAARSRSISISFYWSLLELLKSVYNTVRGGTSGRALALGTNTLRGSEFDPYCNQFMKGVYSRNINRIFISRDIYLPSQQ